MASRRNGVLPYSGDPQLGWGRRLARLLYPGIGLKRWALLGAAGVAISSIGMAYLVRKFYFIAFPDFLPWYLEGLIMLAVGGGAILIAMYGFYDVLRPLFREPHSFSEIADTVYNRRARGRGPRVVAIGGGTGQSTLLRGLKNYTDNLTAIITVTDDGGSSGRLRRELGVLPPGDFRNCLVALSEDDSPLSDLFQYRFDGGNGLSGHSFGNLFIVAMTNVTNSFDEALVESSKVLAVRGQVVPATSEALQLVARFEDGQLVCGESSIRNRGRRISRIMIEPGDASAHPLAIEAIEEADLVVIGPGSLYTSILPNLLVRGISDALSSTEATVVYVCNVATEPGETHGFSVRDHLETLELHTYPGIADFVLANNRPPTFGADARVGPVIHDGRALNNSTLIHADIVDDDAPVRHHSSSLAEAIMNLDGTSSGQPAATISESPAVTG